MHKRLPESPILVLKLVFNFRFLLLAHKRKSGIDIKKCKVLFYSAFLFGFYRKWKLETR